MSDELNSEWFFDAKSVGICGATSTPRWLMENVQKAIQ
jgi:4-hydroxy-3-methylbut-2-enyl diphosphate reductase